MPIEDSSVSEGPRHPPEIAELVRVLTLQPAENATACR